jgi:hypothetical protein
MGSQTKSYDQSLAVLDDLLSMEGHEELAAHYAPPIVRNEAVVATAGDD